MLLTNAPRTKTSGELLEKAYLDGETLIFERESGLERALRLGFFLVKMPEELEIDAGLTLGRHFNEPRRVFDDDLDAYRGFRDEENLCFDRKNYQVEQLIIGCDDRERLLPKDALAVTRCMIDMAVSILRGLLRWYDINETHWATVTGGCATGQGTHWFVANHYKADENSQGLGCAPHTDTGFVTVLYADRPGLEVGIEGDWKPLVADPKYFVVNFGAALETLTRHMPIPAHAALHRVSQTATATSTTPRVSIAAFASAPTHGALFEILPDGRTRAAYDVDRFLDAHDAGTWDESRVGAAQSRSTESVRSTTDIALANSRIGA